jgi:hypothetical protein
MKTLYFLSTILILLFACCKCKKDKEEVSKKLSTLELLQNRWIPISSWIYFPNGSEYQLLPFDTVTFTSDGKNILSFYVTDPSLPPPSQKIAHIIQRYLLLPDDSTLIFYQLVDSAYQVTEGDTSFISIITNHLLVYYAKKNNMITVLDSLKR